MMEPSEPDEDPYPVSLTSMTKAQLLERAEEMGLTGLGGLTKAEIIERLEGQDA